jgi:hypothetical protein
MIRLPNFLQVVCPSLESRRQKSLAKKGTRRLELESLEDRTVPSLTASFPGGASLTAGTNVNVSRLAGNQSEATIAVNPTNPRNLVVVSNIEDVTGDGVADPGLLESFSTNGGATWTTRIMANGGDGLPVACCDPQSAFDQFGNFFLTYLDSSAESVEVVRSADGGVTFSLLAQFTDVNGVDQPSIATGAGTVWVSWSQDGDDPRCRRARDWPGQCGSFHLPRSGSRGKR